MVMPPSWTGHFEDTSGISYVPRTSVLGRDALLLHSPWRVPPGKVWVDYQLQLPDVRPITLSFGIAMLPDVAVPGKSDGVTFGAYIVQDTGTTDSCIYTRGPSGKRYSFDLSSMPGGRSRSACRPSRARDDASWDYSYFGGAKIHAGTADLSRAKAERLTSTHAYKAVVSADLQNWPTTRPPASSPVTCWTFATRWHSPATVTTSSPTRATTVGCSTSIGRRQGLWMM